MRELLSVEVIIQSWDLISGNMNNSAMWFRVIISIGIAMPPKRKRKDSSHSKEAPAASSTASASSSVGHPVKKLCSVPRAKLILHEMGQIYSDAQIPYQNLARFCDTQELLFLPDLDVRSLRKLDRDLTEKIKSLTVPFLHKLFTLIVYLSNRDLPLIALPGCEKGDGVPCRFLEVSPVYNAEDETKGIQAKVQVGSQTEILGHVHVNFSPALLPENVSWCVHIANPAFNLTLGALQAETEKGIAEYEAAALQHVSQYMLIDLARLAMEYL